MTNVNDEILEESKLYSKILDLFLKEGEQPNLKEIWKDRSMIELMDSLKQSKNKDLAKNALILLLSLFDDTPPDLLSNLGTSLETLSKEERENVKSKLKEAFLEEEK